MTFDLMYIGYSRGHHEDEDGHNQDFVQSDEA